MWGVLGLTLQKLVLFKINEEILEAHKVEANITINGSARDPLNELGLGEVEGAIYYRLNFYKNSNLNLFLPLLPISTHFIFRNWKLRYL